MKAETYLQALLNRYGLIYGERVHLLDHIFSVIGNGFDWQDGVIVDSDEDILANELEAHIPKVDVVRAEQSSDNVSVYSQMGKDYKLYPLSDSSLIFHIPEDVREDWLIVAIEWIRYLYMNRTYTVHDHINEYTRNKFSTCSLLLEELASRYLDDFDKLKLQKDLLSKLNHLANAKIVLDGD